MGSRSAFRGRGVAERLKRVGSIKQILAGDLNVIFGMLNATFPQFLGDAAP
jgi:hypothetical protein